MKHTQIIDIKNDNLLLAFSSEVTWIPLDKDDIVEKEGINYAVIKKNILKNNNVTTWYWINVPPTYAGKYNGTIYVLGIENGEQPP